MAERATEDDARDVPVVIRKYNNRRLYNTETASFVTLGDLREMVRQGAAFVVQEASSGRDITGSVLMQIIAEEEAKGQLALPLNYLRQLLRACDAGPYFQAYLEQSMETFAANQQEIGRQMQSLLGGTPGGDAMTALAEIGRRNVEIFQRSMGFFDPAAAAGSGRASGAEAADGGPAASREEEIESLKRQLADLQKRLDDLSAD